MSVRAWVFRFLGAFVFVLPVAANETRFAQVPTDYPTIAEALAAVPDGATLQIEPGHYTESLRIERPVILRGRSGETVIMGVDDEPAITIADTRHVTVHGLTVVGGENGILVLRSRDVVLRNNQITDSRLVGIKVRLGSADIIGNTITGAQTPYGRGIHITNTMDWPTTTIRGNTIRDNAMGGIVTNMAMVRITGNTVVANGQRGIAVTEMSEAVVAANRVTAHSENGVYVSDQSTAIVCNNIVTHSRVPAIDGVGRYGNGITVDYLSEVDIHGNVLIDNWNNAISVIHSSRVTASDNVMRGNGADILWVDESSGQQRNLDLPLSCQP